jgi:hypothetical protein
MSNPYLSEVSYVQGLENLYIFYFIEDGAKRGKQTTSRKIKQ